MQLQMGLKNPHIDFFPQWIVKSIRNRESKNLTVDLKISKTWKSEKTLRVLSDFRKNLTKNAIQVTKSGEIF